MKTKMQDAFNEQIKNEWYSGYLYLAMAAYFEAINLGGFARWMKVQAQEEFSHAMKMFEFVVDCGARVKLKAIPQPPAEFKSPLDVFEKTLKHEQQVTSLINKLYVLAKDIKDYPSEVFLQWFISEQVEEEKSADEILQKLKLVKPGSSALLMIDSLLGKRGEK